MSGSDTSSPFLPLPDDICISSVHPTLTEIVVSITCQKPYALCPRCGACSERVHGHYGRTVADLPCGGRRVILALTVRKFVCTHSSCPQKIFTERLAELVQSYARMTNRLRDALVALGLATSAQVSERVAPSLGMRISAPTLLRRLREVASDGIPLRARGKGQERVLTEALETDERPSSFRSMSKEPRQSSAGAPKLSLAQSRSQVSRTNRVCRYEAVRALHEQLVSEREIARRLKMSRQTVHKFLSAESFPERCSRPRSVSILDPYKPYILDRWKAGCWNGTQIHAAR